MEGLLNVFFQRGLQRVGVGRGIGEHAGNQCPAADNVVGCDGGVDIAQEIIILAAEKREGCDEGPGTDAGDRPKFWPRTRGGPAAQKAGTEGFIGPATGDGQRVGFNEYANSRSGEPEVLSRDACLDYFGDGWGGFIAPEWNVW